MRPKIKNADNLKYLDKICVDMKKSQTVVRNYEDNEISEISR